jgi:hypothetical protein
MKQLIFALLLSFTVLAKAGPANVEAQKEIFDGWTKNYASEYKCPISWEFDQKSVDFASDLERSKFAYAIGDAEYQIRLKCQAGGFTKIKKVSISCGKVAAKYDDCPATSSKDGATVKLSGTTLTITGKYTNCLCGGDVMKSETQKILDAK